MLNIIYLPGKIKRYTNYLYCTDGNIEYFHKNPTKSECKIKIPNNLFFLTKPNTECILKFTRGSWHCFHNDSFYSGKSIKGNAMKLDRELDRDITYAGCLEEDKIYLIDFTKNPQLIYSINIANNNLSIRRSEPTINSIVVCNISNGLSKYFLINKMAITQNGFLHINSANYIDLIFSTMFLGSDLIQTHGIIEVLISPPYLPYNQYALNAFSDTFRNLETIKQLSEYSNIFSKIAHYYKVCPSDNKIIYSQGKIFPDFIKNAIEHGKKITEISQSTLGFLAVFIHNLKMDIISEIWAVYNRFKSFPGELVYLNTKHPRHPYLKLIKMINKLSAYYRHKMDIDDIRTILTNCKNYKIYNKWTSLLIAAIATRRKLFDDYFEIYYLNMTTKTLPKYPIKTYSFPFRVFSIRLYLMEHIFAINSFYWELLY